MLIYCNDVEQNPTYEFVPYKYGGFSFTCYDDKRRLIDQGLLENDERVWKLTTTGRKAYQLAWTTRVRMDAFAKQHTKLRGDALVAETYRRYPYYAIRSEIAERVLAGDSLALLAINASKPALSKKRIATIGYEGRTLESYLNRLLQAGVTLLCDVRRNAFSRKYGFSKRTLQKAAEGVGIHYEHCPELGVPSADRQALKTKAAYDALFERYERDMLPDQVPSLEKIKEWVEGGHVVALTCFESLPEECHRHCVANELARRWGSGFAPKHL